MDEANKGGKEDLATGEGAMRTEVEEDNSGEENQTRGDEVEEEGSGSNGEEELQEIGLETGEKLE